MSGLLGNMSHVDLMMLRNKYNDSAGMQKAISPFEHRAFAREQVAENPINALGLALGIPAYQLLKLLGLHGSRTGADLEQLKQGYVGVGEGLKMGLLGGARR